MPVNHDTNGSQEAMDHREYIPGCTRLYRTYLTNEQSTCAGRCTQSVRLHDDEVLSHCFVRENVVLLITVSITSTVTAAQ